MTLITPVFVEVSFEQLNKIAAKIRTHGGVMRNVQKMRGEGRHKIILKSMPNLSLEEIIMGVEIPQDTPLIEVQVEPVIPKDNEPELDPADAEPESNCNETANFEQLLSLSLNKLRKLGKIQKITRYTKLSASDLAYALANKVFLAEIQ